MSTIAQSSETPAWYAISAEDVAARLTVDTDQGLSDDDAAQRLAEYGPNQLKTEPPPSIWAVGLGQLSNPMNIMLVIVAIASIAIGQVATGIFVALLVTFNVVMGSRQELKARGERRCPCATPSPACTGAAIGSGRGGRVDRPGPGRHRVVGGWRRGSG